MVLEPLDGLPYGVFKDVLFQANSEE